MKWAFGILVLVNAGVFLWAVAHKNLLGSPPERTRPAVHPEAMRLVDPEADRPTGPPVATACYRIGPFHNPDQLALAGQKLDGMGVPFTERNIAARPIRAFRVFLGPFPTLPAAHAEEVRLVGAGVADHYVKQEGELGPIVSLGLFSREESAAALRTELENRDFRPQVRVEDRTLSATYWLELMDGEANRRAAGTLNTSPWGDERARLREIRCQE